MRRSIFLLVVLLSSQIPSLLARGLPLKRVAPAVLQLGVTTDPDLTESSGLVASRNFPGVFWSHNDHGSSPHLFALSRNGFALAKFRVTGATITDWEDISIDDAGNLYIADIGDNDENRNQIEVYRLIEPGPRGSGSVRVAQTWQLKFPDKAHDAETLFIQGGYGWIVTKHVEKFAVGLYRFPLAGRASVTTLQFVGAIRSGADVSGGAISRDGSSLALVTDRGAYLFSLRGDPGNAVRTRAYFYRYEHPQMEGTTFLPEGLMTSAENGEIFLFDAPPFRGH